MRRLSADPVTTSVVLERSDLSPNVKNPEPLLELMEHLDVPATFLQRDCVLTWNTAAKRAFGWEKDEVIGGSLPACPGSEREMTDYIGRVNMAKALVFSPLPVLTKEGACVHVGCIGLSISIEGLESLSLLVMQMQEESLHIPLLHRIRSWLQIIQLNADLLTSFPDIDPKVCANRISATVQEISRTLFEVDRGNHK